MFNHQLKFNQMNEIKPHPNNCPPGHLISIAHGGHGHSDGDGCCNYSPTASISFIIPFLLITSILMIAFSTKKLKDDDERF